MSKECETSSRLPRPSLDQWLVEQFLIRLGHELPWKFQPVLSPSLRMLWLKLLVEEVLELAQASGVTLEVRGEPLRLEDIRWSCSGPLDPVGFADGAADVRFVLTALCCLVGLNLDPVFREVAENNLAKFGPGHTLDSSGKLIKPPGHPKPDIAGVLRKQGWEAQG